MVVPAEMNLDKSLILVIWISGCTDQLKYQKLTDNLPQFPTKPYDSALQFSVFHTQTP